MSNALVDFKVSEDLCDAILTFQQAEFLTEFVQTCTADTDDFESGKDDHLNQRRQHVHQKGTQKGIV